MDDKIRRYVDGLFTNVPQSSQLLDLKEEVGTNLAERIVDIKERGLDEDKAFQQAVAELGDTSELAESMRKAAVAGIKDNIFTPRPLAKPQVFGYVAASGIGLFGIIVAAIVQFTNGELFQAIGALMPFLIVSVAAFIYFTLTKETAYEYAMVPWRAGAYSLAAVLGLFGLMVAGMLYFQQEDLVAVAGVFIPFVIPAVVAFIYLGLTEKSRLKLEDERVRAWIEQTVSYQYTRESKMRMGLSGALWLFSIGIFLLVGLNGGWKYSWIVFVFAVGMEALLSAFFAHRRVIN